MTSDSDDLEEALRENLKLRHELGAKVDKTKKSSVFAYGVTILEIAVALGPLWVISGHLSAQMSALPPIADMFSVGINVC
jgi:hypothetical protein